MNMLFSEIYGCYYNIVSKILAGATSGLSLTEISDMIDSCGFSETTFHMLPLLIEGEWALLEKRGELYYSRLDAASPARPITKLELSWLAAIINDSKMRLFISDEELGNIKKALQSIDPLSLSNDIIYTDKHKDGDDYNDPVYIANFRILTSACKNYYPIVIEYKSENNARSCRVYHPYKICYSELNDKFRFLCAAYNSKKETLVPVTLNLGRILSVKKSESPYRADSKQIEKLYSLPNENPPIILEISNERNALERFMLQFASYERQTEYDPKREIYTCRLYYDIQDETELLIRILSFGPAIKVLEPASFLSQVKSRLAKQIKLLNKQEN